MAEPPTFIKAYIHLERKNLASARWAIALLLLLVMGFFLYRMFAPTTPNEGSQPDAGAVLRDIANDNNRR